MRKPSPLTVYEAEKCSAMIYAFTDGLELYRSLAVEVATLLSYRAVEASGVRTRIQGPVGQHRTRALATTKRPARRQPRPAAVTIPNPVADPAATSRDRQHQSVTPVAEQTFTQIRKACRT